MMNSRSLSLLLLFVLVLTIQSLCQNQANNWFFNYGQGAGITFNSGTAIATTNSSLHHFGIGGTASISDTNGNVLFYSDGLTIYNRDDEVMVNGNGLDGDYSGSQPVAICPNPGNSNQFYVFTIGSENVSSGLKYSIVDMLGDNGKGAVITKNIPINSAIWARDKIAIAKHSNNRDYWIVTRLINSDYFVSYLLTPDGVNDSPIPSKTRFMALTGLWRGPLKFSPDYKKIISAHRHMSQFVNGSFEVCSFNNTTGEIDYSFSIKEFSYNENDFPVLGIEISPDSKKLFVSFKVNNDVLNPDEFSWIYQYDLTQSDSLSFLNSHLPVTTTASVAGLQLAPDGKIYGIKHIFQPASDTLFAYLDRIENVWETGAACNFVENAVSLVGRYTQENLPNFPQHLLYRFVWNGSCAKAPFNFRHRFIPQPESIIWDFGDGFTSSDLIPTHIFQSGGVYEVHAHVVYPDGRIEETSREVTVLAAPAPDLGNDIQICVGASTQLNAGSEPGAYSWSTGAFGPNLNSIIVSDTGTYWVRVRNSAKCYGSDTIRITMFPKPVLDTTNLVKSPTTCGGSTGAIRGLTVTGTNPINVEWRDVDGNVLETGYDLYNLPVNNYYFYATDGNGCTTLLDYFQINDAGDILIDTVEFQPSYCGLNNGSITITAVNGLGDMLDYSINNGTNYVHNQWEFNNLSPGSYNIKVTDSSDCQAVWAETIIIQDHAGPMVNPTFTPATGSNADGTVTLNATGFGILTYTLENITQSDSLFTGLAAGIYHYRVEDENGCFTEGDIEVESIMGITLTAIAGNGQACMGTSVRVPVKVKNFTGVKGFSATLNYDPGDVSCLGLYPGSIHNLLYGLDFTDYPSLGRIVAAWDSSVSVSIQDTALLFELVFKSTNPGSSFVTWDQAPSMTWFSGDYGNINDIEFTIGQMLSVKPPEIMQEDPRVCEGDLLWVSALATGTEPFNYEWILPNGQPYNSSFYVVLAAKQTDTGAYTVIVTDPIGCADTAVFNVTVIPSPTANFPEGSIPFEIQYTLEAPQGYASYEWSNGETNYFITVTEEGEYSVIIKTTEGCESRDTAMLVNVAVPVYVPNAFTPNGDGQNDTFKPIITKPDLVSQYHLSIYNRWGQCFFETSDPSKGWDGKDELPGVYNWVVSYRDGLGKVNQLRGSVTLIK
ncbi:MAG TPA: gliding motility-associated C-terminal domain-containing protein [Lentimicrobium sp.]|nr:gliding motility-associated C-terminal domain-containing protein [Lentimicrobium sp.]